MPHRPPQLLRKVRRPLAVAGGAALVVLAGCGAQDAATPGVPARPGTAVPGASAVAGAPTGPGGPGGTTAAPRHVEVGGVDLTGIGYDQGSPAAPVVVVDFSDFGCPFCGAHARETLPALEREFIATGKVFYKYVPVVMGFPNGGEAARAAACAAEQGRFWPMHDRLYATQAAWRQSATPGPLFARAAADLALDRQQFDACYAAPRAAAPSGRATALATQLGVRATPSFLVAGRPVEGALPLPQFRQLLDTALAERTR